jgi:hypothetical protein
MVSLGSFNPRMSLLARSIWTEKAILSRQPWGGRSGFVVCREPHCAPGGQTA